MWAFVKGLGKGVFGVVAKPLGGALSLIANTAQGLSHSVAQDGASAIVRTVDVTALDLPQLDYRLRNQAQTAAICGYTLYNGRTGANTNSSRGNAGTVSVHVATPAATSAAAVAASAPVAAASSTAAITALSTRAMGGQMTAVWLTPTGGRLRVQLVGTSTACVVLLPIASAVPVWSGEGKSRPTSHPSDPMGDTNTAAHAQSVAQRVGLADSGMFVIVFVFVIVIVVVVVVVVVCVFTLLLMMGTNVLHISFPSAVSYLNISQVLPPAQALLPRLVTGWWKRLVGSMVWPV